MEDFKIVNMMFVDDSYFSTLVKITNSQWYEVQQQHQIKVYGCSGGLRLSVGNLNTEK